MQNQQRVLAFHGVVILTLGLLSGIGFSIAASGAVEGVDYGSWRFAHMEGILNGLLVVGVAAVWAQLDSARPGIRLARFLLILGCYANILGPIITALFIGHRVIVPATFLESVVVYGFYIPGTLPLISLIIFAYALSRPAAREYS
jgi:hypothetical protein